MSQEFGAVLAAGLAVFGLIFVASQADFDFVGPQRTDSMNLFEKNFGTLGEAQSDSRTVSFNSFSVGEARGDVMAGRADRVRIEAKLFDKDEYTVRYNATQPRSGTVEFEVLGRTGMGAVYVKANGQKVFQEKLIAEGTPEITIPATALSAGQNEIVIGTTKGGIFSSAEYVIEDVKVRVNDRKFHDYVDTFRVYDYELQDFMEGSLTFQVGEAIRTSPLNVMINEEEVFSFSTVRGTREVEITPQNGNLRNGLNEIKFTTEGDASYNIERADLTFRYVGATQPVLVRQEFNLNQSQLRYVDQNRTKETLSFNYQNLLGAPRPMNIEVNNFSTTFIPTNGRNEVSLGGQELEANNMLYIRSNGTFQFNNVRIDSAIPEN